MKYPTTCMQFIKTNIRRGIIIAANPNKSFLNNADTGNNYQKRKGRPCFGRMCSLPATAICPSHAQNGNEKGSGMHDRNDAATIKSGESRSIR